MLHSLGAGQRQLKSENRLLEDSLSGQIQIKFTDSITLSKVFVNKGNQFRLGKKAHMGVFNLTVLE